MKKRLYAFLAAILVANLGLYAQPSISCPSVDINNGISDTTLNCTGCANLFATPASGFQTTTYNAQQIPYNPYPFNVGTPILVNIDDIWSGLLPIGFDFCFYGSNYNQCVVGSNGVVSFNAAFANQFCPWAIAGGIPGAAPIPTNAILGTYQDIDPSISGSIRWQQYGTAPCRVFVVSYSNVAYFSCTNLTYTGQIVLYETTNIIEVYIQNKPTCGGWNAGAAIQGLNNATGTAATVVPGRNFPAQWTATNDAWRFVPAGAPNYSVQWFQMGNPTPISNTATTQVCPTTSTTYIAQATYTNCNATTVVVTDTIDVNVVGLAINPNPTINDVDCPGGNNGSVSLNPTGGVGGFTYQWSVPGTGTSISNLVAGTYYVTITDTALCARTDSFVVTQPVPILSPTTTTPALCNGQASGTATVAPTGGTPGYTYQWLPSGGTSATATGLNAGNYAVIVTDANQCRDTGFVQVVQPTPITASASMTPVSCFGGNNGSISGVANGGVGNYSYSWQPINQNGTPINGVTAGTYTLTAADSNGCTTTATVVVTQPTAVSVSLTAQTVRCFGGSNGSASAVALGGTPGYTYAWSNGGFGASINNLSTGTYTVTATDANGCTSSASILVPEPSQLGGQTFATNETCAGFCDATVSVVAAGGTTPYTYAWSLPGGPTTSTVQNVCSGTYSVTITDARGCQFTVPVTVVPNPSPTANAGPDVSFCEGSGGTQLNGSAAGGGGAPYYYTWSCATPPCGLSCMNCANPFANPTDSMLYYLVVTDQNGCASEPDSVMVNVIPRPRVDAGPDTAICGGPAPCTVLTPTILTGFGPFTYQWIPGTGLNDSTLANPCARPDTTTIYALVVTDLATGCTSEFNTLDTVSTVTLTVSPIPVADAGPDRIICEGDTVMLTGLGTGAGPAYDFEWSPTTGLSNPTIINPLAFPPATTEYTLVVWSNNCPSYGDSVTVFVTEIPTVDAGAARDLCLGDSALLDGTAWVSNQVIPDSIVSYTWSPAAGLSGTTTEDVMVSPAQTGFYYLEVSSAQGCTNLDSVLVTVNPSPIVDAGQNLFVCNGTGPWDLDGVITWYNNVVPGDLQNIIIEWQPTSHIVGDNDEEDITIATDSTMYFYFTVTYNTCSHTDSVLVVVLNEVIATASADTSVICSGDSVLLAATGGIGGASFTWSPSASLGSPSSDSTMAAPDSTTTYTVIVNEAGCADTAQVTVNVIPSPDVAFINSLPAGCAPHQVSFTAVTENAVALTWTFGDSSGIFNGTQPLHTYDEPGTYEVVLTATNTGGCVSVSEPLTITVHDSIDAEFSSNPSFPIELNIPEGHVSFFDETDGAASWIWTFGDGSSSTVQHPTHTYSQPGEYYVTMSVANEFGCWSQVTHGPFILVLPDLFIPNVFSPNGDGNNDEYFVGYTGSQPFLLSIFDRWGTQVFQTTNKMESWKGNFNDTPCAESVYYYTVRVGDREFTGNITLLR